MSAEQPVVVITINKKVSSGLECEICTEAFTNTDARKPLLLLCGHSFCAKCCQDLIYQSGKPIAGWSFAF